MALGERLDRGGRRLLHEEVARLGVLEGVEHQVDGVVDAHHEAGHVRVGDRQAVCQLLICSTKRGITEPREAMTLP